MEALHSSALFFTVSPMLKFSASFSPWLRSSAIASTLLCALGFGLRPAQANSPQTAPQQLQEIISQIDAAANRRDLATVMQFYSQQLTHSDGLTHEMLQRAIAKTWERYPQLSYKTELLNWEPQGNALVAETMTRIEGQEPLDQQNLTLTSTIRSRQRIENNQIVQQDILAENSELATGEQPPTLEIKIPEQVRALQTYNFDAIVQEPLNSDLLVGAVGDEPVQASQHFEVANLEFEALDSGGLFKLGKAPVGTNQRWVSAVFIRKGGIRAVTQRLDVVGATSQQSSTPGKP
jgi:hypothetical protein